MLPALTLSDFGPNRVHVVESHRNGRVFSILHHADRARRLLPYVELDPNDAAVYVFIHGGQAVSRFENMQVGTHEVPVNVVADLLRRVFATQLDGMQIRMCTCYGNLLRPGDRQTLVERLAIQLPNSSFEAYHGLVHLTVDQSPKIVLGDAVRWDPVTGPVIIGPRGSWEAIQP